MRLTNNHGTLSNGAKLRGWRDTAYFLAHSGLCLGGCLAFTVALAQIWPSKPTLNEDEARKKPLRSRHQWMISPNVQDDSLEVRESDTPGSIVSGQSHGYQLNLILNDKTELRLNIAPFGRAVDARRRAPACRSSECAVLRSASTRLVTLPIASVHRFLEANSRPRG